MEHKERTFIITGGNSGLGYQCASDIAKACKGDHVIIACRNLEKGSAACKNLISETGNSNISVLTLDLASFESIRNFCEAFSNSKYPPLYGLVCNAAVSFANNLGKTKEGFDMTFGVNHLGHFLLTNLLISEMIANGGRIVFVTSDRHNPAKWMIKDFVYTDAIHLAYPEKYLDKKKQTVNFKYPMSKLCNIYCTYEMTDRIEEAGFDITVNAFNPGFMASTGLDGKPTVVNRIKNNLIQIPAALLGTLSTVKKSGSLLASMMTNSAYANITGKYFDRGKVIPSSNQSYNKENAKNLWNRSVELVHLKQSDTIITLW
ncbi:MAG: SDR family NAD(P)-dependent oxidoreductase [Paludibacter sp.]|nr:SDR family NAD(P)-dependent oxidoreductase [Paludibacter sp.]